MSARKGFDGTYRIAIHRVFGNVTTGKVHVKVMTHYLGKNPVSIEKTIPLVKDEAQIAFDLKDGRRKEPIADQQIANAAAGQLQLNAQAQVLAQQIDAAVDPSALGALAAARSLERRPRRRTGRRQRPGGNPFFGGRGAVGYQPKITTLPEGAMHDGHGRGLRRPALRPRLPHRHVLRHRRGQHLQHGHRRRRPDSTGGTGGQGFGGLSGGNTSGSSGGFGNRVFNPVSSRKG